MTINTYDAGLAAADEHSRVLKRETSGFRGCPESANAILDRAKRLHAGGAEGSINLADLRAALGFAPDHIDSDREPARYIFYDLETTGLSTRFDHPLEVAAVLCDRDLTPIEFYESRCDLLPWVTPSPQALVTTRVRPASLNVGGRSFYDLMDELASTFDRWRTLPITPASVGEFGCDHGHVGVSHHRHHTIFTGWNSLNFDEEMLRHSLFAALHPPYLTQAQGAGRFDVMLAVRTAHLLDPGRIAIPENIDPASGERMASFRLLDVAQANGIDFDEATAHGATADVMATIALARLVRERVPAAWTLALDASDTKGTAMRLLAPWLGVPGAGTSGLSAQHRRPAVVTLPDPLHGHALEPFVHLGFERGRPVARVLLPIGFLPGRSNLMAAIDLGHDPASWLDLNEGDQGAALTAGRLPLTTVRLNRQPIVLPFEPRQYSMPPVVCALVHAIAPDAADPASACHAILTHRLRRILAAQLRDPALISRLLRLAAEALPNWPPSPYVEEQLYEGFPTRQADALRARMVMMNSKDFVAHIPALSDPRLQEHARRRAFTQHPEALEAAERQHVDQWVLERRHAARADVPWRTLGEARTEVSRIRTHCLLDHAEGRGDDHATAEILIRLKEVDDWIADRIAEPSALRCMTGPAS